MKYRLLPILILFPLFAVAQSPCKVSLPALDSIYKGKCKNGLANGMGEAWGKFYYKGKFVSGYPEGEGRAEYPDGTLYIGTWKKGMKNGKGTVRFTENGKIVEKTFVWENDVRQKEILPAPYKILTQRNVARMRVYKQGGTNGVWFNPSSQGGVADDYEDFQLSGTSGRETLQNPKFGFDDAQFPFKGSIRYKAWNKLRTTQTEILVEIEITEPGNWVVEIQQ